MKHLNLSISGRVQGVFFRDTARREAQRLGINGFARNEPNGAVWIEAEGDEAKLDEFLQWCHKGPTWGRVDKVVVTEGRLKTSPTSGCSFRASKIFTNPRLRGGRPR